MAYFQTKNPNLGKILKGQGMEKAIIYYVHLQYITAIWYILIINILQFNAYLVLFPRFWYIVSRKIWQP
jgi:hypothetical protein